LAHKAPNPLPPEEPRARRAEAGQRAGPGPAAYDDYDRDLLDRVRALRITMASWM
jgi:hypothetical protein